MEPMKGKYKLHKCQSSGTSIMQPPYYPIDIIYEDKSGFTWICKCGQWDSESAQEKAKLIVKLLNRHGVSP